MEVTASFQHEARRSRGEQAGGHRASPHLPPALCVLDHDRTGSDSWGVSAESRSSKELLRKKSERTQRVPWSSFGDKRAVQRLPCRHQEPGFRAAPSQGSRIPRLGGGGGGPCPPRRPEPRPSLLLTSRLLPSAPAEQRASLGDRQNVLAVGVPAEAGGAERSPAEDPVQDLLAALAVLVPQ